MASHGGNGAGGTVILNASVVKGSGFVSVRGDLAPPFTSAPKVVGHHGSLTVNSNADFNIAGIRRGGKGTLTGSTGLQTSNPYFPGTPDTPFIAEDALKGIPHAFGVVEDNGRLAAPTDKPDYAIAVLRRFDESAELGDDYRFHEDVAFQNLTNKSLDNPGMGQSGIIALKEGKGLSAFEAAYWANREVGSKNLNALGANEDWVTLVNKRTSLNMSMEAAGFSKSGDLSDVGDVIYLISPKLEAKRTAISPQYLLVGKETDIEFQVTNLKVDAADDLQGTIQTGSNFSLEAANGNFTLAEGQSRTFAGTITATQRGGVTATFSSNDFFDPEAAEVLGTGVAPNSLANLFGGNDAFWPG